MSKFLRPAIIGLALIGTISAASAHSVQHSSYDWQHKSELAQELEFWAQFTD